MEGELTVQALESQQLRQSLQSARHAIQTSQEELKSSNEELQSTNEELQSTNEELQSTNEELITSREEMQSMNEELRSVHLELTAKLEEMSCSSDDMKNLLNSTRIATLYLDEQLRVRRYTPHATRIFKLIPSDIGRPITDQVTTLDYPDLASDVKEVLRSLVCREVKVRGDGGRWFSVCSTPYRTHDNRIDGVVITFVDISTEKLQELILQQARALLPSQPGTGGSPEQRLAALEQTLQKIKELLESR
jgi:two-component system CheB/CheR fusion protein